MKPVSDRYAKIYWKIHELLGRIIFIASRKKAIPIPLPKKNWTYTPIKVTVPSDEGKKPLCIDGVIATRGVSKGNGRWMFRACGINGFYEKSLDPKTEQGQRFLELLEKTDMNLLCCNYPSVGRSEGPLTKENILKTYSAMRHILKNDCKAEKIVELGTSIGGGVQSEYAKISGEDPDLLIKDRSFSSLSQTVSILSHRIFGQLIRFFGWDFESSGFSKNTHIPEIIIQTAHVDKEMTHVDDVKNDGVIHKNASLARELLADPTCDKTRKIFLGVTEKHTDKWKKSTVDRVAFHINAILAKNSSSIAV